MASFTPDFEKHYHSESFSDVALELFDVDAEVGGKRKRETTIPGHSMVLMAFSNYCKVKLENWNSASNSSTDALSTQKHTIQLPVPVGQLETATRLIQAMYQKTPAVQDLSQQQLLQLLLLADRFEVAKVQAAVVDAFAALSEDELHWETALALLDLPFVCDQEPRCKELITTADRKLLQRFGDWEVVWADEQLWLQLLQLPHAALLRLVQHDQTCVENESTVVFTILSWWEQQQQSYRDNHVQQLKQLMQHIRMQHLSLLYINTFMMSSQTVLSCYSMRELAIACSCTDTLSQQALRQTHRPELEMYPAWTAAKRPASKQLQVLEWNPSLSEIQDAVESLLSGRTQVTINGPHGIFQGHGLRLQLRAKLAPRTKMPALNQKVAGSCTSWSSAVGLVCNMELSATSQPGWWWRLCRPSMFRST